MIPAELRGQAEAWIADDPDPGDRAELRALLDAALADAPAGNEAARNDAAAELADRFAGRLEFGTAGLRGAMGAGPNRMNRAVVRGATAALAGWLREHRPGAADAGVVIGWDARRRSVDFAAEAAGVLAGAGIRVHLLPDRSPTPLLAFAVRRLAAAAGIMITASHNPPDDNGYKLYLGDGAQIVPPTDAQIEAAIGALGPLAAVPLADLEGPPAGGPPGDAAGLPVGGPAGETAGPPVGGPAGETAGPPVGGPAGETAGPPVGGPAGETAGPPVGGPAGETAGPP